MFMENHILEVLFLIVDTVSTERRPRVAAQGASFGPVGETA